MTMLVIERHRDVVVTNLVLEKTGILGVMLGSSVNVITMVETMTVFDVELATTEVELDTPVESGMPVDNGMPVDSDMPVPDEDTPLLEELEIGYGG